MRGNSDYDIRHNLNAALVYRVPSIGAKNVSGTVLKNWQISPGFMSQSGYPIDVISEFYTNPVNGENNLPARADLVPGMPFYLRLATLPGQWGLNPAAFTAVPTNPTTGVPLREGTLGRNYLHGPNIWQLNIALERDFALFETLRLDFRVDAFNLCNHPTFSGVDNFLGDPTFGQLTGNPLLGSANVLYANGGSRSLQLSLRLHF